MAAIHNVYAYIANGEVQNVVICEDYATADYLAKTIYGPDAFAVECTQYRVGIGDKYHDGRFWSVNPDTGEETEIPYTPTTEQQVSNNTRNIDTNRKLIIEVLKITASVVNMSSVKFDMDSPVVKVCGTEYMNSGFNLNVVPNVGDLRTVILDIFGPGRSN